MLNLSNFAERLKELMFDKQISTKEFAKILSVDETTLRKYLRGASLPSAKVLIKIADYFNCTTDFILCLESEKYDKTFRKCPPFNERLAFLLEEKHKSKSQLKQEKSIPESAIYNWQRGDFNPSAYNLEKLAEFFECSIDYVLGRSN